MEAQITKEDFYGTWKTNYGTSVITITKNTFHQKNNYFDFFFNITNWIPVENTNAETKGDFPCGYMLEIANPNVEAYNLGWEHGEKSSPFYMHKDKKGFIRVDLSCGIFTKQYDGGIYVPLSRDGNSGNGGGGGCYIATACYGSYDCPQVVTFRNFRDTYLAQTMLGKLFIKTYYALSPHIAQWLKDKNRINGFIRVHFLDRIYETLRRKF